MSSINGLGTRPARLRSYRRFYISVALAVIALVAGLTLFLLSYQGVWKLADLRWGVISCGVLLTLSLGAGLVFQGVETSEANEPPPLSEIRKEEQKESPPPPTKIEKQQERSLVNREERKKLVSYLDLPQELLTEIFSLLPHADIAECLVVCRYWYQHISSPLFLMLYPESLPLLIQRGMLQLVKQKPVKIPFPNTRGSTIYLGEEDQIADRCWLDERRIFLLSYQQGQTYVFDTQTWTIEPKYTLFPSATLEGGICKRCKEGVITIAHRRLFPDSAVSSTLDIWDLDGNLIKTLVRDGGEISILSCSGIKDSFEFQQPGGIVYRLSLADWSYKIFNYGSRIYGIADLTPDYRLLKLEQPDTVHNKKYIIENKWDQTDLFQVTSDTFYLGKITPVWQNFLPALSENTLVFLDLEKKIYKSVAPPLPGYCFTTLYPEAMQERLVVVELTSTVFMMRPFGRTPTTTRKDLCGINPYTGQIAFHLKGVAWEEYSIEFVKAIGDLLVVSKVFSGYSRDWTTSIWNWKTGKRYKHVFDYPLKQITSQSFELHHNWQVNWSLEQLNSL